MNDKIIVAGICGSLREGSYTRMVLNIALLGAKDADEEIPERRDAIKRLAALKQGS